MAGDGFGWIACTPSLERRRWLRVAAIGCGAVALALLAAAIHESSPLRGGGLTLAIIGAVVALRRSRAAEPPGELRLDAAGVFWWRDVGQAQAERLRANGLSRWLAEFDGPSGRHCIWRDSLPAAQWRILCACVRWHVDRDRPRSRAEGGPDQLLNR